MGHISDRRYLVHPNWLSTSHPFNNKNSHVINTEGPNKEDGYLLQNGHYISEKIYNKRVRNGQRVEKIQCKVVALSSVKTIGDGSKYQY